MYLSAISYQPMSVSRNLKQQNSTVNFKAGVLLAELVSKRSAKQREIANLRRQLALKSKDGTRDEVKRLEHKILDTIKAFNKELDDYLDARRIFNITRSDYYLH